VSFKEWWAEKVVGPDPDPEYSSLDRADGLGVVFPNVDGTPFGRLKVTDGVAEFSPVDARAWDGPRPSLPRAHQPSFPVEDVAS
jgi:hypothetical protein